MPRIVVACTEEEALRVRPLVVAAYDEMRARHWPFLSDVLERTLRGVGEEDRAIVTAAVQALVKYDRLLGFVSEANHTAAHLTALFRLARVEDPQVDARLAAIHDATERTGIAHSLPDWIVEAVKDDALLASMNEPAPRVVRVNTLKTTREACLAALAESGITVEPTKHAAQGIVLSGRRSPFRTQAFADGELEVQDEASQLVAELVAPPPRSFVVDACAGAGGKTLSLAALVAGKGKVLALDSSESKLEELRRRARRAGASNVQALVVDWAHPPDTLKEFDGRATRVLLDAPCTGLGAIRRNPEARWRLRPDDLAQLASMQASLLRATARLVAPHGRLVYAVCSFLRREAEDVIDAWLAEEPAFSLVTVRDVLGRARTAGVATPDGRYLRTWRYDEGETTSADGFFAAVLRRNAAK